MEGEKRKFFAFFYEVTINDKYRKSYKNSPVLEMKL